MKTHEEIKAELDKKYGKGTIQSLKDFRSPIDRVSSGSIIIDALLDGGFPRGRMTEIYGTEASGKTTLALQTVVQAQKMGLNCLYVDVEQALYSDYMDALGVDDDPKKLIICQPECGEEAISIIRGYCESGLIGVVVLDSVAAMTSKPESEGSIGDANMGVRARIVNQAVRVLSKPVKANNVAMIWINQLRQNLSGYGSNKIIPGGKALDYACSVKMELARTKKEEDRIEVKATLEKNKIGLPFKSSIFEIVLGKGTSIYREMMNIGVEKKLWELKGAWYVVGEQKIQGSDKMAAWIEELEQKDNALFLDYLERCKE